MCSFERKQGFRQSWHILGIPPVLGTTIGGDFFISFRLSSFLSGLQPYMPMSRPIPLISSSLLTRSYIRRFVSSSRFTLIFAAIPITTSSGIARRGVSDTGTVVEVVEAAVEETG